MAMLIHILQQHHNYPSAPGNMGRNAQWCARRTSNIQVNEDTSCTASETAEFGLDFDKRRRPVDDNQQFISWVIAIGLSAAQLTYVKPTGHLSSGDTEQMH